MQFRESKDSEWIVVGRSHVHEQGVFAKKDIPKGTRIIEYTGEKITKAESARRSERENGHAGQVYIFELNKRYDIDGAVGGSDAIYINHSCEPNCEVEIIRGRIWIVALRDIKEGEELGYDYNFDLEDFEEHPCNCGSKKCRGFIVGEEHWPKLKRLLAKKKKAALKKEDGVGKGRV
ncbi:SET domain-containing protein-lysine N-methyltransferase [Candidatus Woesearchaeota archaeon]|nr:MAG: SET domain-containing protein-lysine N-methyltransferase [Candidatus Woesearchaeota archaeon]